jgi:hypothetical protein
MSELTPKARVHARAAGRALARAVDQVRRAAGAERDEFLRGRLLTIGRSIDYSSSEHAELDALCEWDES